MFGTRQSDGSTDSRVTRRTALRVGCGTLVGGGVLTLLWSDGGVAADVTMGSLDVTGDSATLGEPPAAVTVSVSGEYDIQAGSPVEQSRTVLQLHANGDADDLDETMHLDSPMAGSYSLSADLLDHRSVDAQALFPDTSGTTTTLEVLVRVVLLVVQDGEVTGETFVEETVTLEATREGIDMTVGGTGGVTIQPQG